MAFQHPFADKIEDLHPLSKGINLLVYSDNGCGKTPLAATAPDVLFLDADHGVESALAFAGPPNGLRKVVDVYDWSVLDDAYDYLRHEKHPFKWVVLDGISGFQDIGLENIMVDVVAQRPHRKVYHPDKGEFGENMNRIKLWCRHMAQLDINFIINAHIFFDEGSPDPQFMPWIQGRGMPQAICGYMAVIGHLRIEESQDKTKSVQVLQFKKRERHYARDRFGALGDRMVNPTIPKIEQLIKSKMGELSKAAPVKKAASKAAPVKKSAAKAPAKKQATKTVAKKAATTRRK